MSYHTLGNGGQQCGRCLGLAAGRDCRPVSIARESLRACSAPVSLTIPQPPAALQMQVKAVLAAAPAYNEIVKQVLEGPEDDTMADLTDAEKATVKVYVDASQAYYEAFMGLVVSLIPPRTPPATAANRSRI